MKPNDLELSVRQTGERIFKSLDDDSTPLFSKDTWYRKIMDWSMKNEHFKVQMFRFVDVLPYLNSGSEVAKHLKEYFAESGDDLPSVFSFGLGIGSLAPGLLAAGVKKNVTSMAKMFITGESPQDALPALKKARKQKITFTADLLGEATLSEREATDYLNRYLELIQWLARDAATWENIPQIDQDENGAIPKVNVSVKVTALYSQIDEAAWDQSLAIVKERVRQVFRVAMTSGVFINLDMEQYAHKDFLLQVFEDLIMEEEFRRSPNFGIVLQAYLRDAAPDAERMIALAKRRGTPFTIRLVKGAYWDFE
ncbi:MAG TPA: proline dehydrogenase family protein, partial [Bdellovibrionales bacterium]|nr:proline dehydrogenase family protein [Bdellovibrionales bacterium]